MAKQNVNTPEIESLGEVAMTKTELFFQENGKKVTIAIFVLLLVASALFGYKSLVIDPAETKASQAIYSAQTLFESATPDYLVALNGSENITGFLDVIEEYGSTATGNLANHYAGVCYLKLGDNVNAKRYLQQYKSQKGIPAMIITAQNLGLQGDIAVDDQNYTAAVALYLEASKVSDNALTTPLYLRKAAQATSAAGNTAQAKTLLEQVITEYPNTIEARNAEKLLGTL